MRDARKPTYFQSLVVHQFPISTVEDKDAPSQMKLSTDLGTTPFNASERASMLWRWIDKAIDAGEFVEMAIPPPPEPPPDRTMKEGAEPRPPREF